MIEYKMAHSDLLGNSYMGREKAYYVHNMNPPEYATSICP